MFPLPIESMFLRPRNQVDAKRHARGVRSTMIRKSCTGAKQLARSVLPLASEHLAAAEFIGPSNSRLGWRTPRVRPERPNALC